MMPNKQKSPATFDSRAFSFFIYLPIHAFKEGDEL
jgi:hypothetical protein